MAPETYELAIAAFPDDVDVIPNEIEPEEDVGPIEDPDAAQIENPPVFFVEENANSNDDDISEVEESETKSASSEESVPVVNKRIRIPNSMLGSVEKGKYSAK